MSLRLLHRPVQGMHLLAQPDTKIPRQNLRPPFGPDRFAYRGTGAQMEGNFRHRAGGAVQRHPGTRQPSPCPSAKAFCRRRHPLQRADEYGPAEKILRTRRTLASPAQDRHGEIRPFSQGL